MCIRDSGKSGRNIEGIRKILKPPDDEDELLENWNQDGHYSLVIFRHPFSRLASAYYNKMVNTARIYAQVAFANILQFLPLAF